jgi:hypothetical protein
MAKFNHVATVVAGINSLVKALSLLRLHCYHQWNEGFECSFQQHSKLWQNSPARFNQTWIKSFKVKPRNKLRYFGIALVLR